MKEHKWIRVSKQHPCSACGKPDWCTFAPEAGLCCCMRLASSKPAKNGGWLHSMGDAPRPPLPVRREPKLDINPTALLHMWRERFSCVNTDECPPIIDLAANLGVSVSSLDKLECVPAPYVATFAFPMKDARNATIGIRLRNLVGDKWAEKGSFAGLFIPLTPPESTVFIVEGPTSCAAMLSMGLWAIGRPSCSGGVDILKDWLSRNRSVRRVAIIADTDQDRIDPKTGAVLNPGIRGAKTLQEHLPVPSVIVTLPAKDSRSFLQKGGTKQMIESMVSSLVWRKPTV